VYDGNVVIQERDANGLPWATYTRGNDLSSTLQGAGGIGGLLARTDAGFLTVGYSGAHAYYHADGNGNITALINTNQALVAKYLYDPFGNILSQSGSLADANLYRFSSKEFHKNSGLVYYLYRYYQPSFQRWVNRDPIAEWGGINAYRVTWNNPIGWIDPYGLTIFPPGFIGPLQPGDGITPMPPAGIPGGPWKWYPNPQNPRGGHFMGPKGLGGRRPICTYAPPGSVNNNKDPYWKSMDDSGNTQRYDGNGNPITPGQAHPSPNPPPSGNPPTSIIITPGVPGLSTYPVSFPVSDPVLLGDPIFVP
jgi:RHS repeat-associated protein